MSSITHCVVEYREREGQPWKPYALWTAEYLLKELPSSMELTQHRQIRVIAVKIPDDAPVFQWPNVPTAEDLKMMESKPIIYDQEVE